MSLKKFPDYMYEIVVQAGEAEIGTFTIDADGELTNMYLTVMINGVGSLSNEAIHLRAIRSSFPSLPVQSSSILVSSFASGDSWIGKVRFDFAGQSLLGSDTIQVFLGTENYTFGTIQIGSIINYIGSSGSFEVLSNKAGYLTLFNDR